MKKLILVDKEMEVYECPTCESELQFEVQLGELRKEERVCPVCGEAFDKEFVEEVK